MQPQRTLDSIIAELNPTYNPQIDSIKQRQSMIPDSIASEEQGLQAKQTQAFGDILNGARQRGLGFSGIPLSEQAKYTSAEFLPALARLRQSGKEQAMSLEDALNQIYERRNSAALGIQQNETSLAEQQRQFNENLAFQKQQASAQQAATAKAAKSASFSPTYGGGAKAAAPAAATIARKQDGGFAFADQGGNAISAAKYAQLNKQDIRDVLYQMGSAGDNYSQQLYNQIVSDPFFGKGNATYDKKIYQTYSPIFWGTF